MDADCCPYSTVYIVVYRLQLYEAFSFLDLRNVAMDGGTYIHSIDE